MPPQLASNNDYAQSKEQKKKEIKKEREKALPCQRELGVIPTISKYHSRYALKEESASVSSLPRESADEITAVPLGCSGGLIHKMSLTEVTNCPHGSVNTLMWALRFSFSDLLLTWRLSYKWVCGAPCCRRASSPATRRHFRLVSVHNKVLNEAAKFNN